MKLENLPYKIVKDQKSYDYFQVSLTILVTAIFIAFAIRPSIVSFIKIRKEIKELRSYITALEEKDATLKTAKSIYEHQEKNFKLLDLAIPQKPEEDKLLTEIDVVSVKSQVKIEKIDFELSEQLDPNEIAFSITTVGNYVSTENFLRDLHNHIRVITIDSIEFITEEKKFAGTVTTQINGFAYFEKNK